MIDWIKKVFSLYRKGAKDNSSTVSRYGLFGGRVGDPVYNCEVYKREGCAHVDGCFCGMKTCAILKEYKCAGNRGLQ